MKRLWRHPEWRLWIGLAVVACIGVLIAAAATWASGRYGGSSDAAFALPTVVKSGQPVTHTVYKRVTKHLPPRTVIRHGKTVQLPGRTVSRLVAVSVPGPPTTVVGPTRTATGPGGVTTVISTKPGTTITQPGTTVTGPGTTITEPGTTVTEPGTTITETVTEPGTTVTETITVTTPPST